jgi:hypothetical protein
MILECPLEFEEIFADSLPVSTSISSAIIMITFAFV